MQQDSDAILKCLKQVTKNVNFEVRYSALDEKEKNSGVGEWAICFESDSNPTFIRRERIFNAVEFATKIALAYALAEIDPNHFLIRTWHLNPENMSNLQKFDCSEIDFSVRS